MKLMNNDRKQIMIRVPRQKAKEYEACAECEGYAILSAWIVSVLNQKLSDSNLLSKNQPKDFEQR